MNKQVEQLLNKVFKDNWVNYSSLFGGMMNRSYLINTKDDKQYILYIPGNDSMKVDRELEKFTQDQLARLGITSKNIYFDINAGIKINEFISGSSLDKINEFNYLKVSMLLHKLHESRLTAKRKYDPFNRFINEYEKECKNYIKDFDKDYLSLKEFLFTHRDYLENQKVTLCHNDFQRSNIIKSSNDSYYMIDFEFAMDNDPIYDISAFGNNNVLEGRQLLTYYFLGKENVDQIKRFYLWRIYLSLQWYIVALNKHYKGEGEIHQINFLDVAKHFLDNAKQAKEYFDKESK